MASQIPSTVRSLIRSSISQNPVMIFSKSYCPYCLRVKDLFDDISVPYKALELDEHELGTEIQQGLKQISGQSTVPNVYVKGHHIGGSDNTQEAKDTGRLKELLNTDVWAKLPEP
ncbi:glutaredoxin [Gamsiella multidivaricata]|uniref:glutaredoxin n=1 Tax=Gamsiella multidivaricata TaxID=101098 RepID=UPI00221E5720|nr:glutaredoxin [Gamsiella multidivaricata]KAG0366537.1 hypothetical protein BGZ54_005225 [Gamsiella multidivaricata]KAI7827610.1 glutaredoxin [Gamsiella multidivaricata]